MKNLAWLCLVAVWCIPSIVIAQRITYAEPEREDSRQLKFEVIGKMNGQYLVYKNIRNTHYISVYDRDMHLVKNTDLNILDDRLINVDFVAYPDIAYMIYQYQRRGIVYCMGARVDNQGVLAGDPVLLDTTVVGTFGDNKVYSTVNSDDKKKIVVFKVKGKKSDVLTISTILLNDQLQRLKKSVFTFQADNKKDVLTDFYVDNDGDFVFGRGERSGSKDNIAKVTLAVKRADADSLVTTTIVPDDKVLLDEVKLKVDNYNKRYLLNSFYSKTRRGNIEGLYTAILDKSFQTPVVSNVIVFNDELRAQAKGDNNVKTAFNDYFIKHIVVTKDKGYLLTAESNYTSTRGGSPFNRYDYLSSPYGYGSYYGSSLGYYGYSPFNNYGMGGYGYSRYGYPGGYQSTRYYSDNIVLIDIDKSGKATWTNVINKSQFDDDDDDLLSFQVMLQGGELHFLFNEWQRRNPILTDNAVNPEGKLTRQAPLRSMDKGFEFMIRYGKQVSSTEMIVPCVYRNYVAFAKVDYGS